MASPLDPAPAGRGFATTQWSLVLRAGGRADAALAELCERYWYPLYAYVRRRGVDADAAQDLTQDFFARLLEKDALAAATPERGRFRSFLLTSLQNFLANAWDKGRAAKRGGGRRPLSLDVQAGEERWSRAPAHAETPERLFERQWALTLLEAVLGRLEAEAAAAGKTAAFVLLKDCLAGDRAAPAYRELAARLGLTEAAARQAAHRLRRRYRTLLRAEVARTVADPAEVDEEISRLFTALGP